MAELTQNLLTKFDPGFWCMVPGFILSLQLNLYVITSLTSITFPYFYILSKTDKIRFAHYRIWRQIDIIGYLNGSTSSKFVSASFKSFTFGAEYIYM